MTSFLLLAALLMPQAPLKIAVFSPNVWRPDPPAASWRYRTEGQFESNGLIIRAPKPGQDLVKWRKALETFRQDVRNGNPECVVLRFDGRWSWVRLRHEVAKALAIQPGEAVTVTCRARCTEGNGQFGLAFEIRDMNGQWRAWSEKIIPSAALKAGGPWQSVTLTAVPPDFDPKTQYAEPIVGKDAVLSKDKGTIEVKDLTILVATSPARQKVAKGLKKPLDLSLYDRKELQWASKAFTSAFLFLYDATLHNAKSEALDMDPFLKRMRVRYGGADVVLLWQAYPRIGVDERNQFDFFRDLPGGLAGLKAAVDQIHQSGAKAMIPYNPWDTGTRREGVSDAEALAQIVKAIGADGVFLDTMNEPQAGLREELDRLNLGQSLEPEGTLPDFGELGVCDSSWGQWLPYYPEPGILVHKWIEPRHMQHQIRRWNTDHGREIDEAFFNASGMLVWENVFGTWNPWSKNDAAKWLVNSVFLRSLLPFLQGAQWLPYAEARSPQVVANLFVGKSANVALIVNQTEVYRETVAVRVGKGKNAHAIGFHGLGPSTDGWATGPTMRHGAFGTVNSPQDSARLEAVAQYFQAFRSEPPDISVVPGDHHPLIPTPTRPVSRSEPPSGMVFISGASVHMKITHQRRECGCFPDPPPNPSDPKAKTYDPKYWTWGDPWWQEITHDYQEHVGSFFIDEALVTNGDFEKFLNASGYVPKIKENFLKHWGRVDVERLTIGRSEKPHFPALEESRFGPGSVNRQLSTANQAWRCPPALRDLPVVCVDLDDARAYAKWAGKRLPTEAEWQLAAQGTDGRKWPWGDKDDPSRRNGGDGPIPDLGATAPTSRLVESGAGSPHFKVGPTPVRAYPNGRGPNGLYDTTGNVYQWTESERLGGNTRYCILRGGSWFEAKGSGWYVLGGAHPLDHHTKFLLLGPALNRCSTIGFRCVKDARSE